MNVQFFLVKFPEQYTLTINLVGSSIKGKVNEANTASKFAINLDLIRKSDKKKEELCNINNCELFRIGYNYSQEDYNNLINTIQLKLNCYT